MKQQSPAIVVAKPTHNLKTHVQIDQFYSWIFERGLARLAERGITPQMLYTQLHGEGQR